MSTATAADLHLRVGERHHPRVKVCPHCDIDVQHTPLPEIAYVFRTCDCGEPSYTHLVEQLWHLQCLVDADPDPLGVELLRSAVWALEQHGPGSVAKHERAADRLRDYLAARGL